MDAALPSDILVAESVNRGVPVVISSPRSKFAKSIDELATGLMANPPPPSHNKPTRGERCRCPIICEWRVS